MAHDCDECGQTCFCDGDDTGGLPQPNNCPHLAAHPAECLDDDDFLDDKDS